MSIRVIVADDHSIIRQGLKTLCARHPLIQIIAEAANGQEAVDLTEELTPDVVVMDITMPVMDGVEATSRITTSHPKTRVIALSMHTEPFFLDKMKAAGATGYVAKEQAWEELVIAIETVANGGSHFPGS